MLTEVSSISRSTNHLIKKFGRLFGNKHLNLKSKGYEK